MGGISRSATHPKEEEFRTGKPSAARPENLISYSMCTSVPDSGHGKITSR